MSTDTTTIRITRVVAAPPDRVFAAWVDPAQLARWWWPQLAGTTYDVDARLGGHYRIHAPAATSTQHEPDGDALQGWNDVLGRLVALLA